MPYVSVGQENSAPIELYYEDHGSGPAVILIHGWPLNSRSWEKQVPSLLHAGYRVISYDRRGFGASSQPAMGYHYDTFAQDLHALITQLALKDFALVGFSMGGGEVARYVGLYGTAQLRQAVFISSVTPYLRKAAGNAEGVDPEVFEGIQKAIVHDRPAFLKKFFKDFYNLHSIGSNDISEEAVQASWLAAVAASPIGTHDSVAAWGEDFRADLQKIDRPTLVIHGKADKTVPFAPSGERMPQFVKGCQMQVLDDAPHGLLWTHADKTNQILLHFLKQSTEAFAAVR